MAKHIELSSCITVGKTPISMDVQRCADKYLIDIREDGKVAVFSVSSVEELKYFLNDIIVMVESAEVEQL
jgi:hypothetical protein